MQSGYGRGDEQLVFLRTCVGNTSPKELGEVTAKFEADPDFSRHGWLHRSARPIPPQASPVWKVWNLQIVSFEYAQASAALAASFKRAAGK
jgi:hypothetical protein